MKTRNGFVSNSSSSSFCVIGTENSLYLDLLKEKDALNTEDPEHIGYGMAGKGKTAELDWWENYGDLTCVGVNVSILEKKTLPAARKHVQKIFKKIGVDVPLAQIDIIYGSASSG